MAEKGNQPPLDETLVRQLCESPEFVAAHDLAAREVGLWESEKILADHFFPRDGRILDVGCGAGRVALGLCEEGFPEVEGIDFAPAMIQSAREEAVRRGLDVRFEVGTARDLPYPDDTFAVTFFSGGGWMQIPGRENRRRALRELFRVTQAGGMFWATTYAREMEEYADFWTDPARRGEIPPGGEFGDLLEESDQGMVFIHVPSVAEVEEDLRETGWTDIQSIQRSMIADEPPEVLKSSDECLFWHARKPD